MDIAAKTPKTRPSPAGVGAKRASQAVTPAIVTLDTKWAREDEDVQLMLAFQRGDESAFPKLVQRNQANVFAVIYRFLGDQSEVEDLTQEVFLRVFRTVRRYSPTAKFSTWLYRIAANLSLNAIRARSKVKIAQLEMPDDGDGDGFYREVEDLSGKQPYEEMDSTETRERIMEAINSLPENQKIAIILNKYEHMSYDDIAEVLGCSMMAVKSLLSRARCNLRQALIRHIKSA